MVSTDIFNAARSGQGRIGAAISQAAARTGVDFGYLFNQAKIESGFDPSVRARTSSATGLFQFIDQTWLATVSKHGAQHGLGWAAAAIQQGSDGRYRVADGGMRAAILDLRKNPEAASSMAAEFASDNRAVLENSLGRRAEPVDLYLAHFLGAGGASAFLSAHDADPGAPAAQLLPQAARANRSIFFARDGGARSFGEIRDRFAAKLGGTTLPSAPTPSPTRGLGAGEFMPLRMASLESGAAVYEGPRLSPEYARLAYLMLAEIGG